MLQLRRACVGAYNGVAFLVFRVIDVSVYDGGKWTWVS